MVSTDVAELWVYLITVFSDLFLYVGISVSLLQRNRTSRMYYTHIYTRNLIVCEAVSPFHKTLLL